MYNLRPVIVKALQEVMGDRLKAVFDKSERTLTASSGIEARNSYLLGSSGDAIVKENGLRFKVGWEKGQKTGFLLTTATTVICLRLTPREGSSSTYTAIPELSPVMR